MSPGRDLTHSNATRVVHAGATEPVSGTPILGGPVLAGPFHLTGAPGDAPYGYGRAGNPTWSAYEGALGELEGAEVVLFGSGMAAESAVLLALGPGDVLVAPTDAYFGIGQLAREHLVPRGVEVRMVENDLDAYAAALDGGATLCWAETPSNPHLHVLDVRALAAAAHAAGAAFVVDNTLGTPLGQHVLDLRADVAVVSASKSLTGHHDLVLGYVATRDAERAAALRAWRTLSGSIAGPFETWLAHRSLATLALRLERSSANALALARLLARIDGVGDVRHPLWDGDPGFEVASAQMAHGGPLVCFSLPTEAAAERFLAEAQLVVQATSFGGVHTSAERRGRWGTDRVDDGFIRLSAGIEAEADLLADIEQAVAAALRQD